MDKKHIILIRKSTVLILILILSSAILFTGIYNLRDKGNTISAFSYKNDTEQVVYKDFIIEVLNPYVNQAIEKYYGESKSFIHEDIIKVDKVESLNSFEITVKVTTSEDEQEQAYAVDTITIVKSFDMLAIKDFKHEDIIYINRKN